MKMTADEREKYSEIAKSYNMTLSQFFRSLIEKKEIANQKIIYKTDPKVLRQIAGIGNNLNQIAKKINANPNLTTIEKVEFLRQLQGIEKRLENCT